VATQDRETPTPHSPDRGHDPIGRGPQGVRRLASVSTQLRAHAPFTLLGTLTGIGLMVAVSLLDVPRSRSVSVFWCLHPLHVLLSALVTTAMSTLHGRGTLARTVLIGYAGSVGIASGSDCVIPYVGEILLGLPHRGIHLGFIEKWWLVNPLAAVGIILGYVRPHTRLPHAGHVLLSTWASLFHIIMATDTSLSTLGYIAVTAFLFLAVWIPCCTSDIVFPMWFAATSAPGGRDAGE
jgi:hypothetical protein